MRRGWRRSGVTAVTPGSKRAAFVGWTSCGVCLCLLTLSVCLDYAVEERPSEMVLMQQLEEGGPDPLVFVLNANLLAMVKLVNCECPRYSSPVFVVSSKCIVYIVGMGWC